MAQRFAYIARWSPVAMALFLLTFGALSFLLTFFGYVLALFDGFAVLFALLTALAMILLTIAGVRQGKEGKKAYGIASACLPLLGIFFVMQLGAATDMHPSIYVMLASVALGCGMILFFACSRSPAVKIALGILYSLAMMPAFLILSMMTIEPILPSFGHREVVQAVLSPHAVHQAEIIAHSQGALGGSTEVLITRPDGSHINLFIGELQVSPRVVFSGRWGAFERMTLRWETDEMLYLYFGDDTMIFSRGWGNRWSRQA